MHSTLLRIDSSLRQEGSYSRALGDYFTKQWQMQNPTSMIKQRDLSKNKIDHLNQETLACFFGHPSSTDMLRLSDELIAELIEADEILITAPMYNFGIPSTLKTYFDLVVRQGKTYTYQGRTTGMLHNKRVYIITSMGGENTDTSLVEMHLQRILHYIGITDIHCFTIDGTADQEAVTHRVRIKKNEIINLLENKNESTKTNH